MPTTGRPAWQQGFACPVAGRAWVPEVHRRCRRTVRPLAPCLVSPYASQQPQSWAVQTPLFLDTTASLFIAPRRPPVFCSWPSTMRSCSASVSPAWRWTSGVEGAPATNGTKKRRTAAYIVPCCAGRVRVWPHRICGRRRDASHHMLMHPHKTDGPLASVAAGSPSSAAASAQYAPTPAQDGSAPLPASRAGRTSSSSQLRGGRPRLAPATAQRRGPPPRRPPPEPCTPEDTA